MKSAGRRSKIGWLVLALGALAISDRATAAQSTTSATSAAPGQAGGGQTTGQSTPAQPAAGRATGRGAAGQEPTGRSGTSQGRRSVATPASVEIRVTDRSGAPAADARVIADGPVHRDATTDSNGIVTFRMMTPGTYRFHAEGDGFIALEKETAIKNGPAQTLEFSLSPAPPVKAPPPPPPAPAAPAQLNLRPGSPVALSIPDMAERSLRGTDPVKRLPIGCSGATTAELVLIREAVPQSSHPDIDELLYVVAGEATLKMADKEQPITPGWFTIVPRGTTFSVTRRGRNPAIVLSIVAGPPCAAAPPSPAGERPRGRQ